MSPPSQSLGPPSVFDLVHAALTTGLLTPDVEDQISSVLVSGEATEMDYAVLELLLDAVKDEYVRSLRVPWIPGRHFKG